MDLREGTRVYLPASVMVNTYCKENRNCENIAEIEAIINKLQQAVGSTCIVTESNYLEVCKQKSTDKIRESRTAFYLKICMKKNFNTSHNYFL